MKEIVKATGLSKGAFYHYFNSKEQLFKEILDTFLSSTMNVQWDRFPRDSLRKFLDYFDGYSKQTFDKMKGEKNENFNINYFSLFFDGLKLFPEFKTALIAHQKRELDHWIEIVGIAKNSGEIKSQLGDEQIARMFLHISDGAILSLILAKTKIEESMIENIKELWEGFYNLIKA